jgi:hypothetical protein
MEWSELAEYGRNLRETLAGAVGAGPVHRRRIADVDLRITVMGSRGKSMTTRWLHDVFHERGYDTYAKVTGTSPVSLYNGTEHDIERSEQVRLYENEREIRRYDPEDVMIVENQGIRGYTTRLVNQEFVAPHIVFLTNVREDHLDTLGAGPFSITRELARAVPAGTHVVNGERDSKVREYLEAELHRRNATVSHVRVPSAHATLPGVECLYGINHVLRAAGKPQLSEETLRSYRESLQVSWRELPGGRVYDAADVNDVQSTELVRRSLAGTAIEPILFLREDRRGRTASFLRYLDVLAEDGIIQQAHVVGTDSTLFARRASFPVFEYDPDETDPDTVLDAALAADQPVVLMGNTVHEFMDQLQACIDERTRPDAASGTVGEATRPN